MPGPCRSGSASRPEHVGPGLGVGRWSMWGQWPGQDHPRCLGRTPVRLPGWPLGAEPGKLRSQSWSRAEAGWGVHGARVQEAPGRSLCASVGRVFRVPFPPAVPCPSPACPLRPLPLPCCGQPSPGEVVRALWVTRPADSFSQQPVWCTSLPPNGSAQTGGVTGLSPPQLDRHAGPWSRPPYVPTSGLHSEAGHGGRKWVPFGYACGLGSRPQGARGAAARDGGGTISQPGC